jgi:hypothetical protein
MTQPRTNPETPEPPKPAASGAKKRPPKLNVPKPPDPPPRPHWLVRLATAPAVLMILWPLILIVGGFVAWNRWGEDRLGKDFYRLEPGGVSISPAPDYIRSNIVSEVFATHQLEKVSLLNRLATAAIGEAFRTHPWVDEVIRVEKSSNGVDIQLRYRKPIAWVRVASQHPKVPGDALFLIDAKGTMLPTKDFSAIDETKYIHIEIPNTYPSGDIGAPYGDDRVIAAARLAAVLATDWQSLNLRAIGMENPSRTFNEAWVYTIYRQDLSKVIWGSTPGEELPGEPTADEKLLRLQTESGTVSDLRTK